MALNFSELGRPFLWRLLLSVAVIIAITVVIAAHRLRKYIIKIRKEAETLECSFLGVVFGDWSLLHVLAYHGHALLLRILVLTMWNGKRLNVKATGRHWTPLHCAATKGHKAIVSSLARAGADLESKDDLGHTGLAIAAAYSHEGCLRVLLNSRASANARNSKNMTPLHIAAMAANSSTLILALLKHGAQHESMDDKGWTPFLVACCDEKRWPGALTLLQHDANPKDRTYGHQGCGQSATMLLASWKDDDGRAMQALLSYNGDLFAVDCFGQSALHMACRSGKVDTIRTLCANGAPTDAQDNDGLYPLQLLCTCCAEAPKDERLVDVGMEAILQTTPEAVQWLDFSDTTALHTLCTLAALKKSLPLRALRRLLDARADPSVEGDDGWTPVHFANSTGGDEAALLMEEFRKHGYATCEFWENLDLQKPRNMANRKYLLRRGGHHRIPIEDRRDVLRCELDLAGIARRINQGRSRRVVVIIGAGASTAAGIPDFRSPMGLWSQAATRDLFSPQGIIERPEAFWRSICDFFVGRKPTKVHKLLARLAEEGLVQRIYTQNIDHLEVDAGIPADLVIECHGSALRIVCSKGCGHVVDLSITQIGAQFANKGEVWKAPLCEGCGAFLRPDIVFFGESLPADFRTHSSEDMSLCDMLIVVGTALSVYPVAGLVQQVKPLTPRLLLNREPVGPWQASRHNETNYRDVFYECDCDAGAEDLARLLNFELDLSS